MGRHFILENSGASKIFQDSPLRCLEPLGLHFARLDQCMYGAKQEEKHVKKNSVFVSDCQQTGLDTVCDHHHEHVRLRGQGPMGSRTAAAARYPDGLCDSILASIAAVKTTPQDGGRKKPSHTFATTELSGMSKFDVVVHRLHELRAVAQSFGFEDLFQKLVDPWIADLPQCSRVGGPSDCPPQTKTDSTDSSGDNGQPEDAKCDQKASDTSHVVATLDKMNSTIADLAAIVNMIHLKQETSQPSMARPGRVQADVSDPLDDGRPVHEEAPVEEAPVQEQETAPKDLESLFKGDLPEEPWQEKRYSPDNRIWQAAAMRKRQHTRRSNVSLGVCTVDLSGPHEPSPRPGRHIQKDTVTYFLVLTLRPDRTAETIDMGTQTDQDAAVGPEPRPNEQDRPLLYATCLGFKAEATEAIKGLLAKINDDHGNLPHTLYFRLHSDRGGEFLSEELKSYCRDNAIHKTTTQGHDPNANASAELAVGTLKRRCRYLLAGSRLPTKYWGMGVLAAAQMERADLGVGKYPRIPFGTRGMVVTSPAPRNAWVPRAEPCTIFGTCDDISDAQWVYQKGLDQATDGPAAARPFAGRSRVAQARGKELGCAGLPAGATRPCGL